MFGEAIQFADSFTFDNSSTPEERIFVNASAIAILPDAIASFIAKGDLSPIAMASPSKESKFDIVIPLSATGT